MARDKSVIEKVNLKSNLRKSSTSRKESGSISIDDLTEFRYIPAANKKNKDFPQTKTRRGSPQPIAEEVIEYNSNKSPLEILSEIQQQANKIPHALTNVVTKLNLTLQDSSRDKNLKESFREEFELNFEAEFDEYFNENIKENYTQQYFQNNPGSNSNDDLELKLSLHYMTVRQQYRNDNYKIKQNEYYAANFEKFYQKNVEKTISSLIGNSLNWKNSKIKIGNLLTMLSSLNGANLTSDGMLSLQKMVNKILYSPAIKQLIEFTKTGPYSKSLKKNEEINLFLTQVSAIQKVMNKIVSSCNLHSISDDKFLKTTIHEILTSTDNDRKLSSLLALADHLDPKIYQVLGGGKVIANQKKSKDINQGDMGELAHNAFCDKLGFKGKLNRIEYLAFSEAIVPVIAELSESDKSGYMVASKLNNGLRYLGAIAGNGPAVQPAVKSEYDEVDANLIAATTALKNFVSKPKSLVDRFATAIGVKRVDEPLKTKHKLIVGALGVGAVIGAAVVVVGGAALATALAVPEAVGIVGGIIAAGVAVVAPSVADKVVSVIKSGISGLKHLFGKKPTVVNQPEQEHVVVEPVKVEPAPVLPSVDAEQVVNNEIVKEQSKEHVVIPDNSQPQVNNVADHERLKPLVDSDDDGDELNESTGEIYQNPALPSIPEINTQPNKFGEENKRSEALNTVAKGFFDKVKITDDEENNLLNSDISNLLGIKPVSDTSSAPSIKV